jgi:hypothetical protein
MNPIIDPLIYAFRLKDFRKASRKFLGLPDEVIVSSSVQIRDN